MRVHVGDADMEGKVALILLCKVFSKKGPESTKKCGAAAIIYEERQVGQHLQPL